MKTTSPEQQIPHEVFGDFMERHSYNSMKDCILQPDLKAWKPSTVDGKHVLSFNVEFSAETNQLDYIRTLTHNHQVFAHDTPEGSLAVLLSAENSRVECNGKSIHGENFIYITDKANGFLFCDKTSKTFLRMPDSSMTALGFAERLTGKVGIRKDQKAGNVVAEIVVTAPFKLKYLLELDTGEQWAPFRQEAACMLIGCSDRMSKAGLDLSAVAETGIPVKGEVFMERGRQTWEKMSSFTVSDLQLVESKDDMFSIPGGYKDLRDADQRDKRNDQRTYFGPSVQLSDYRKHVGRSPVGGGYTGVYPPGDQECCGDDTAADQPKDNAINREAGGLRFPSCLPETYGALLSSLVDEKLLDDIKYIANGISKRTLRVQW